MSAFKRGVKVGLSAGVGLVLRQDSTVVDDFDRRNDELVQALGEAVALLRKYGVEGWADWLELDRVRIQGGDGYGLDHVLRGFGGMGSLNDVVIHPANGNPVAVEDIDRVNKRLAELLGRIYANATWLRRKLDREAANGKQRSA